MLGTTKNSDGISLYILNNHIQIDHPLKKEITDLERNIKTILVTQKISGLYSYLSDIFDLRIKATKWIFNTENNIENLYSELISDFQNLKENKKIELLVENILFALRCLRRVAESFADNKDLSNLAFSAGSFPDFNYNQFVASIRYAIPDNKLSEEIISMTNNSLKIELIAICAKIIDKDSIAISSELINKLAFDVADLAQEYTAIASELGFSKLHSFSAIYPEPVFDVSFVKEQKNIADLGLEDFKDI